MTTQAPGLFDVEPDTDMPIPSEANQSTPPESVTDSMSVPASGISEAAPPTYTRREFHYATHVIPDPSPALSIDEVRTALMPFFPDLVQATHSKRVQGDTLIVTFAKQVTRKGADLASAPHSPVAAPGYAIRTLPRFRDPLAGLCFAPNTTLADLYQRRTDIRELIDVYHTLPETLRRMGNQCRSLPPAPLPLIPHGF